MLGLVALRGQPVAAQRVNLSPQLGYYIPTRNLFELTGGQVGELKAGPSFGARLGFRFGGRFGIDATAAYVPTTFKLTSGSTVRTQNASIFNGSGQLVFQILPRTSPVALYVAGGVGVITRGGVAVSEAAQTTDLTGVIGAGAGVLLGGFRLTAGADLYAYSASFGGTARSESFAQRDYQIKVVVGIPVGGRAGLRERPGAGPSW